MALLQSIYSRFHTKDSLDLSEHPSEGKEESETQESTRQNQSRVLRMFFSLDKSKIKALADAFNENGANISMYSVARITGFSHDDSGHLRGSLLYFAHDKLHHSGEFQSDLSFLEKNTIEDVTNFIENMLDEKGLQGLDKAFTAANVFRENENFIRGSGCRIDFQDIRDENDKLLGFMPLARFVIETSKKGTTGELSFTLTVEGIRQVIEIFDTHYKDVRDSIEKDRKAIGELLILAGDD